MARFDGAIFLIPSVIDTNSDAYEYQDQRRRKKKESAFKSDNIYTYLSTSYGSVESVFYTEFMAFSFYSHAQLKSKLNILNRNLTVYAI